MRAAAGLLVVLGSIAALPASRAAADAPETGVRGTVIFEGEVPDPPKGGAHDDIVVTRGKLRDVVVRVTGGDPPPQPTIVKAALAPVELVERAGTIAPRMFTLERSQTIELDEPDARTPAATATIHDNGLLARPTGTHGFEIARPDAPDGGIVNVTGSRDTARAYGVIADNRFHAVTAADGTFEIMGLPPGTYTLEAWHPSLGTRTLKVVVGVGNKAVAVARLSYKASDAPKAVAP